MFICFLTSCESHFKVDYFSLARQLYIEGLPGIYITCQLGLGDNTFI